jgi:replication factor C subunit 3/5
MYKNRLPHLLFFGPPGTGKTSTVVAIAHQLYGGSLPSMVLSLNASDDRGINVVREQIKTFAGTRKLFSSGMKLVILDEADHMTNDAQFALRRVIEKYSSNARFCIICNYVSKLIPALQSRCTKFRFSPLDHKNMLVQAKRTVEAEQLNIDDDAVEMVVTLANGDMRRVLNVLQACSMAYDHITVEKVCMTTGSPMPQDIEHMLNWLFNENVSKCYELITQLQNERGVSLAELVRMLGPWIGRLQMEPAVSCYLYDELSNLEHRLAFGVSEKLQLGSLVGIFRQAADKMGEGNLSKATNNIKP